MKIDDILNLNGRDLLSMTEKQLQAIANALTSASNKRIRRIEASGVGQASSAVNARRLKSGKVIPFSAKLSKHYNSPKKRKAELRKRIGQMKEFMTSYTGNVRGAREVSRKLGALFGIDYDQLSINQQRKFWEAYNKFKQDNPGLIRSMSKEQYMKLREDLFSIQVWKTSTGKLRVSDIDKSVNAIAEQMQGRYNELLRGQANDSPLSNATQKPSDSGGLEIIGEDEE